MVCGWVSGFGRLKWSVVGAAGSVGLRGLWLGQGVKTDFSGR